MYKGRTLLERFNDPRSNEPLTGPESIEVLAKSVLNHLQKMLNTRRGSSLTQPDDYGMIDLTAVNARFPDSIADMQKAIRTTIEKYEPRLRNVQVEYVESDEDLLNLRFKITAQISAERGRVLVSFETIVEPSGQVQLRE